MRAWGAWATIGFALLAFGLGQAVGLMSVVAAFGPGVIGSPAIETNGSALAIATLTSNAVATVTLVLAARLSGASATEYLALAFPPRREIAFALAWLAVLIVLGDALALALGRELVSPFQLESYRTAGAAGTLPWLWLAVVIAAPIGEEILFRGFLFRGLIEAGLNGWSVVASIALVWCLLHIQYDWVGVAQIFILGMLFGWLRWRSGSTALTILLHAVLNLEGTIETALALARH